MEPARSSTNPPGVLKEKIQASSVEGPAGVRREPRPPYTERNPIFDQLSDILGYDITEPLVWQYATLAVRRAKLRHLESGTLFAEIEGFPGVWAQGASEKEALETLEEVLLDWLHLKIEDGDRDIPPIGSIDLNVL
jgi:predicted RNase H-like HicB family nuclease